MSSDAKLGALELGQAQLGDAEQVAAPPPRPRSSGVGGLEREWLRRRRRKQQLVAFFAGTSEL
jgi:hypothetical protein